MVGNGGNLPSMSLPMLTEKNWDRWSKQMKVLFNFQEVSDAIEDGLLVPGPDATEIQRTMFKEAKKKDNKALFLVHQCVDDTHFEKIQNANTAKEAWDILVRSHSGGDKIKKMKACGEVMTNLMIIEKVRRSLPQKFDYIVVAIEESKDVSGMKIEELQSSLEAHEMRLLERNPTKNPEQALKATSFRDEDSHKTRKWKGKKSRGDPNWSESSDRIGRSRRNWKQKKYDKRNVECFKCHKNGHYSYKCFSEKAKNNNDEKEAYTVQEELEEEPLTLMVTNSAEHSHESYFDPSKQSSVKFADDSTLKVEGT
ncbi:PREDICTED: uncharacterized protein LOC109361835 [Lupinus angustifolius]|uniref:uncharacterized protein LOC109361835 n=1 Tax=Lupinus angustifolius TaxID=3871 RepID=UPI00092F01F1|nr:PREDICTED: uncharacterized protein LOC109361835 [Lupinus angustifolius]